MEDDAEILTSIRTALGEDPAAGTAVLTHVLETFILPMCNELSDAENDLKLFKFADVFSSTGAACMTKLNKLWAITARLPTCVSGDSAYWIKKIRRKMPSALKTEFDLELGELRPDQRHKAASDVTLFSKTLAKAINSLRISEEEQRATDTDAASDRASFSAHSAGGKCPSNCRLRSCPKARDPAAKCDVFDILTPCRAKEILDNPKYAEVVNDRRAQNDKPKLEAEKPAVKTHAATEHEDPMAATMAEVEAVLNMYSPAFAADCDDQEQ